MTVAALEQPMAMHTRSLGALPLFCLWEHLERLSPLQAPLRKAPVANQTGMVHACQDDILGCPNFEHRGFFRFRQPSAQSCNLSSEKPATETTQSERTNEKPPHFAHMTNG